MILQIRLREGEDDDVIAWLEHQTNKSEAIRQCVRVVIKSGHYSAEALQLRAIVAEAMREVLADVVITAQQPDRPAPGNGHEDPVLAARLDSLFD
jgi:hypothetical protein